MVAHEQGLTLADEAALAQVELGQGEEAFGGVARHTDILFPTATYGRNAEGRYDLISVSAPNLGRTAFGETVAIAELPAENYYDAATQKGAIYNSFMADFMQRNEHLARAEEEKKEKVAA